MFPRLRNNKYYVKLYSAFLIIVHIQLTTLELNRNKKGALQNQSFPMIYDNTKLNDNGQIFQAPGNLEQKDPWQTECTSAANSSSMPHFSCTQ